MDGAITLTKQGTELVINHTFTINYFNFTAGALGIHLDNAPNTATPTAQEIDFSQPFPATTVCDELMKSGSQKFALT